jgi:penicillin-binding protein 2
MANAMCLIANRGWYYTPHFVKEIEGETKRDTILNKYRQKISPLHIPNDYYQAVIDGMEMVVTNGTARNAAIDGYLVCAKTGTVENYFRNKKQQNHSFFVAFAPKDNPKIAICVVVENAGYGGTWAAPIASLLMEKFLTDSIAGEKRKAEVERISNVVITPAKIKYELYRRDSIKQLRDSLQRKRVRLDSTAIGRVYPVIPIPGKQPSKKLPIGFHWFAILPSERYNLYNFIQPQQPTA